MKKRLRRNRIPHVSLGSVKTITNLTEDQYTEIKDSLTYTNPEYVNAKRFSGYSNIRLPQYLTYYEKIPHGIRVPVGFDTNYLNAVVKDYRTCAFVAAPSFALTLREDQRDAAEAYIRANTKRGAVNGLIQMPTGKGKTITGLYLASYLKQRTLVIVHKTDLVRGWREDVNFAFNGKVTSGIIGGGKYKIGDFITVATVQTLSKLSEEKLNELRDYFGFVIVDECHHTPASTYSVINEFSARYKLGLTATPERKDGLKNLMTDYLGDFCYKCVVKQGDKDILPVDVIIKKPNVYFDPICTVHRSPSGALSYKLDNLYAPASYEPSDDEIRLSEVPYTKRPKITYQEVENIIIGNKHYAKMVVQDMVEALNNGNSSIAFFRQKEHCNMYYHRLIRAGVPEELIQIYNGDCTPKQLETCLQRAESREALLTLTTFSKSTEGTNVKSWEVAFLVGSANDGKNVEQAVGRVRRVAPNKLKRARVYDYDLSSVYMLGNHIETRIQRYQKLGFRFVNNVRKSRSLLGRGF